VSTLSFIIEARDKASEVLHKVGDSFSAMRAKMSGIGGAITGAFSVTAILAFAKSVLDYSGQIKDASEATGLSTERFQALSIAAKQNGVGMDQLTGSLARLQNIQGSIGQDKGLQETFGKLGLSVSDVQTQNPEQLLEGIAKGLKSTGDASTAFDIFGRGAATLLTTLGELENGWDPLVAKMRAGIISDEDIQRLDEAGDMLDEFMTKTKVVSAQGAGKMADAFAFWGKISAGESWRDALSNVDKDRDQGQKQRDAKKAAREAARLASQQAAAEQRFNADLGVTQKEASSLDDQKAKASLSDKEYETRLQGKVNELIQAANEQGLDALEKQKRTNEATKATIELLQLQKRLEEEITKAAAERAKAEQQAKKGRMTDESQYKYHAAYDQMKPEEKLAQVEKNIANWNKRRAEAGTEQEKADATKGLIGQLQERDKLKLEITEKGQDRQKKEESLMMRDREMREATMTPSQRVAESKKRAGDLEKQLSTERDPDKQLDIKTKLMDELQAQMSISKQDTGRRSMTWGDVAEKGYGQQAGKKDPAREQVEVLHRVETLLKDIKNKRGGMGP
jgi:hypothetical protein